MFFYFVYEILIKKYNVQIVKDFLEFDTNVKKDYPLEEIVIKHSKNNRSILERIYEDEEFDFYNQIDNIV
jgi:hypothetical protein